MRKDPSQTVVLLPVFIFTSKLPKHLLEGQRSNIKVYFGEEKRKKKKSLCSRGMSKLDLVAFCFHFVFFLNNK